MKCTKCGFIFNGPEIKCPYCGSFNDGDKTKFLNRKIIFWGLVELTGLQIISLILINIFIVTLGLNIAIDISSFWSAYAGLLCGLAYLCIRIIFVDRNLISAIRKVDFFISLIIALWIVFKGSNDFIYLYVLPVYVLVVTLTEFLLITFFKKLKFVSNMFYVFWHVVQISVPYILLKSNVLATGAPPFVHTIYLITFAVCVTVFINYFLLFILSINNKAKEWLD